MHSKPSSIIVRSAEILGLFDDRAGVCLNCGTLADPVPNEAMSLRCESTRQPVWRGRNPTRKQGDTLSVVSGEMRHIPEEFRSE
jgi:hypothetical protein